MNPVEPENIQMQPSCTIINTEFTIHCTKMVKCLKSKYFIKSLCLVQKLITNPKFMRLTCFGTAGGTMTRERKVQWTSVGWGQEQARGQGAKAPGDTRISSTNTVRKRNIFRLRSHSCLITLFLYKKLFRKKKQLFRHKRILEEDI